MEKPIELTELETAAVSGGLLNNIFVNTAPVTQSFNTGSFNTNSLNSSFNTTIHDVTQSFNTI